MMTSTLTWFISVILIVLLSEATFAEDKKEEKDTTKTEVDKNDKKKKKKPKEPKFEDLIKEYQKTEGLFTVYYSDKEGKVYLDIRQDHFGTVYLCNVTRQSGDAYMFDSGAMVDEFPFFIKQVGKQIQFIRKNVAFRASKDAALNRALQRNISNSIWESVKIASQPHPETGSILVKGDDLFLNDLYWVAHITGKQKTPFSFDKKNSYISKMKSFSQNTEIEATLHFKSSKPNRFYTLPDSRSMLHRIHYSLSSLPETDYKPRIADDRVGHFLTMYQDYTSVLEDTPYKRFINRWHLQKSEPKFKISKPKQPIVFWIENTVPVEYRDAVRQGILLWNDAFEKIGFQNAIEVHQMPDDADWDPADVRYSTIRWIVQPGGGYAAGPSRANPFTGQIYDADIRVSSDFVRFFYREFGEFITPLAWQNMSTETLFPAMEEMTIGSADMLPYHCHFSIGLTQQMGFGWSLLLSRGIIKGNEEDLKEFVHDGLVDLIVHEVGHTLGLRHNFKASSTISMNRLTDKAFTENHGISGSVMDYNPVNVAPKGEVQGSYFQTVLGHYDYWAIEYAYKPLDPDSKQSEKEMLENIAKKAANPRLQYATDEDAYGYSTRAIDPLSNLFDLGSDPLTYFEQRAILSQELWISIPDKFEIEGERYQKYRLAFSQGIGEYARAAAVIPRYIGGLYMHRDHIGDPDGRPPFEVVPAEQQRRALRFINKNLFSQDAFHFSPELLNRLAPQTFWDFEGTVWRRTRVDYPIHGMVQLIQASAMLRLYAPLVLQRVQDNEIRVNKGEKPFTMAELFEDVRKAVWQELDNGKNISSFRRELQRMHLYVLNNLVIGTAQGYPHDAVTLARADLVEIQDKIGKQLDSANLDRYSRAHLEESRAKIKAILEAQFERAR